VRIQSTVAATFWLFLLVFSPSDRAAQSSTDAPPNTAKRTTTAARCHALLGQFKGKDADFFSGMTDDELSKANDSIFNCAVFSFGELSRFDLSVAATAGAVIARELQSRDDRVAYDALLKGYKDLLAKTAPKPSNARTVLLTVSPLPNGFTRTLSVRGQENTCVAVEVMQIECRPTSPNSGYVSPTRLIAMLATPKPLPMFEHSFLMGCNPDLSANCFPLVAGDYPVEYVGTDGISIAGIVSEDKPNDPPRHGSFVIFHRGEVP
jgi:hypothetical protein